MVGPMLAQAPSNARFSTLMVSGWKGAASSNFRASIGPPSGNPATAIYRDCQSSQIHSPLDLPAARSTGDLQGFAGLQPLDYRRGQLPLQDFTRLALSVKWPLCPLAHNVVGSGAGCVDVIFAVFG